LSSPTAAWADQAAIPPLGALAAPAATGSVVKMQHISKAFGAVQALKDVNLTLGYGEVLGLVGDNAAGKSTLMKILTGAYLPDQGTIFFDGEERHWQSPHESRVAGIEMVYQDFALAGNLDIAANIFMGREPTKASLWGAIRLLDEKLMAQEARNLLDRLKIQIRSVHLRVENLSGGQRQAVAIARATAFQAKMVIMDEPTAALAVKEVTKVLTIIRGLKEHNIGVIIISHRLQDIFQVCDRIMVLRQGRNVGDRPAASTSMDEIVGMMVGAKEDVNESIRKAAAGD
jgi:simple sugar transport system ATP-binding protein